MKRGEETDHFYGSDVNDKVQFALMVVAIIGLVIGTVGVLLIRQKQSVDTGSTVKEESIHMTVGECLRSKEFIILFASLVFTFIFWGFIANDYKVFGLTKIDNDVLLSMMGSVGSGIGTIARFTWGWLLDNLKFKWVMTINCLTAMA